MTPELAGFDPTDTWRVFDADLFWADDLVLVVHRSDFAADITVEVAALSQVSNLVAYHSGVDNSAHTAASVVASGYTIVDPSPGTSRSLVADLSAKWASKPGFASQVRSRAHLLDPSPRSRPPVAFPVFGNRHAPSTGELASTDFHRVVHDHIVLDPAFAPYKHLSYICPETRLDWVFDILDPERLLAREEISLDADSEEFAWEWFTDGSPLPRSVEVALAARLAASTGTWDVSELSSAVAAVTAADAPVSTGSASSLKGGA